MKDEFFKRFIELFKDDLNSPDSEIIPTQFSAQVHPVMGEEIDASFVVRARGGRRYDFSIKTHIDRSSLMMSPMERMTSRALDRRDREETTKEATDFLSELDKL